MSEITIPPDVLKNALKEAIVELASEQNEALRALVAEVIEDVALGQAMQEGEATEVVSRERIFDLLEGRP